MSGNKVVKSISFNITNDDDRRYLERIESLGNFSGYVKRLIEKDIKSRKVIKAEQEPAKAPSNQTAILTSGTTKLTLITR
jgi:hypothetical protein